MKLKLNTLRVLFAALFLLAAMSISVVAVPQGPDTISIDSSGNRSEGTEGVQIPAQAGNVSALTISDTRITSHWAGFYGNVSGSVTLQDAANNTFFDWSIATPLGEVYASNNTVVTWADIKCENLTNNGTHPKWNHNGTTLNRFFNINNTETDTFVNTFNWTYANASGFDVGSVHIGPEQRCPMAFSYVNGGMQDLSFRTVLLTDNQSIVFTGLIEADKDGFRTGADLHDFQLLAADDGVYNLATTPYYFFVELQ